MRAKWKPTKENIDAVVKKIDPAKLYNRNDACKETGLAGSIFDRYVRLNSLFLAYGQTVKSGRFTFYQGKELIEQFERLRDGKAALELFEFYYHPNMPSNQAQKKFLVKFGMSMDMVFAEGTYLELGGWKGSDW